MSTNPCNATIIHRHDVYDQLTIIRVQHDDGTAPAFQPGQFVMLGLPRDEASPDAPDGGGDDPPEPLAESNSPLAIDARSPAARKRLIRRAYSIASSANERTYLEIFIVLIQEGALTPRIWKLHESGRIWMEEHTRGKFMLPERVATRDVVFVATGTGIAPFLSMLRTYAGTGRWRRCALIFGVREAIDFGYHDELQAFAAADPSIRFVPICSREPEGSSWRGLRGRVQAVLEDPQVERYTGFPLDGAQSDVFLCGNPAMVDSVRDFLTPRGFRVPTRDDPGNLHFERYW